MWPTSIWFYQFVVSHLHGLALEILTIIFMEALQFGDSQTDWIWFRFSKMIDASSLPQGNLLRHSFSVTPIFSLTLKDILRHSFPAVERATCTLRTDTDNTKSWDLAHKTKVVISAKKTHTHTHESPFHSFFDCCSIGFRWFLVQLIYKLVFVKCTWLFC